MTRRVMPLPISQSFMLKAKSNFRNKRYQGSDFEEIKPIIPLHATKTETEIRIRPERIPSSGSIKYKPRMEHTKKTKRRRGFIFHNAAKVYPLSYTPVSKVHKITRGSIFRSAARVYPVNNNPSKAHPVTPTKVDSSESRKGRKKVYRRCSNGEIQLMKPVSTITAENSTAVVKNYKAFEKQLHRQLKEIEYKEKDYPRMMRVRSKTRTISTEELIRKLQDPSIMESSRARYFRLKPKPKVPSYSTVTEEPLIQELSPLEPEEKEKELLPFPYPPPHQAKPGCPLSEKEKLENTAAVERFFDQFRSKTKRETIILTRRKYDPTMSTLERAFMKSTNRNKKSLAKMRPIHIRGPEHLHTNVCIRPWSGGHRPGENFTDPDEMKKIIEEKKKTHPYLAATEVVDGKLVFPDSVEEAERIHKEKLDKAAQEVFVEGTESRVPFQPTDEDNKETEKITSAPIMAVNDNNKGKTALPSLVVRRPGTRAKMMRLVRTVGSKKINKNSQLAKQTKKCTKSYDIPSPKDAFLGEEEEE